MISRLVFRHRSALLAIVGVGVACLTLDARPSTAPFVASGVLLALAGAHVRLHSVRILGKSARVHHAGGRALHVVGPYARVRNPLYVANVLITAGLALLAAGPFAAVSAVALVVMIYHAAVRHEEAALSAAFGDEYREYQRQVPRWLPRLRAPALTQPPPSPVPWREVATRERALMLGLPAALGAVMFGRLPVVQTWKQVAAAVGAPPIALLLAAGSLVALGNVAHTELKLRRRRALRAVALGPVQTEPSPRLRC